MPNFKDKVAKWNLEAGARHAAAGGRQVLPAARPAREAWQDYSLAVRTDILQQLNLHVPKTWDELYTVLKAMKAAYPDIYPFSDRWSKPTPGGNLLSILGAVLRHPGRLGLPARHLGRRAPKKFVYTGATDQYKQMLEYLNKLVNEKLLDPESFTQTDDAARQKLANGKSFVISCNAQTLVNELPARPGQDHPGRDGGQDPAADRARPARSTRPPGWRTAS